MFSKRLSIYGFVSAAAVVSGLLVGCGGSSSIATSSPVVHTSGGFGNVPGTGPAGTVGTGQQVQVSTATGPVNAILPAGETIPASGAVAVINPTSAILSGLSGPSIRTEKSAPAVKGKALTGSPGQVWLDGTYAQVTITSLGLLSSPFLLTPGPHKLVVYGPLTIVDSTSGNSLTVGEIDYQTQVSATGDSAIPALNAALPVNGGSFTGGHSYVQCTYPTPAFSTGSTTLQISYSGTTITKGISLKDGYADYTALGTHPNLPQSGVDLVSFKYAN